MKRVNVNKGEHISLSPRGYRMKNTLKIKVIVAGMLVLFMIISATPAVAQTNVRKVDTAEFSIDFSTPILKENNDFYEIVVSEADGVMTKEGCPLMPVYLLADWALHSFCGGIGFVIARKT
jgi:hypothetical protein